MKNIQPNRALSEQEQIAALAHQIYEDEGRPEGLAEEHWARAERSIHEQRLATASPKVGRRPKR